MSKLGNNKKLEQLGMPIGTASNRLRKSIIFHLVKQLNQNYCFQCGVEIKSEDELSIEHKIPYLDSENPIDLFFDLENIGFSHLNCNVKASRKRPISHPGHAAYRNGCKCEDCKKIQANRRRKIRAFKAHVEVATGS